MKKWASSLFMLFVSATILLGACSSNNENGQPNNHSGNEPKATEAAQEEAVAAAGEFPIVKEQETLRVMVKGSSIVENFATNEFTKWLEEKSNLKIEWEVAPENSFKERLNLALSSGDYPDVLLGMEVDPVQQALYGKDGVFLALNDMIEKYGVETKKMFEAVPYVEGLITVPDGNIYGLPQVNECFHCNYGQKMWINQTWLDKLGLKMPETTEEFREVLRAFKEQDPNDNGKPDEIPLVSAITGPQVGLELFLMGSFLEKDDRLKYIADGKVQVAYNQEQWKEGLAYIRSLYEEGLIASQTFTQDRNQLKQMGMNPDGAILGAVATQNPTVFLDSASERFNEYVALAPLTGPNGVRSTAYSPFAVLQGRYIITDKAKNPEAAFRLADLLFSEEAALRSTIGRPDEEWEVPKAGELGINGEPATWKQIKKFGELQNVHWAQSGPSLRTNAFRLGQAADPNNPLEVMLYNETKNKYAPYAISEDKVVPPIFFSNEEAEELATIEKSLEDYRKEFFARAVTGDLDVNKDWDSYLKNLNNMGLPRYLEIYQNAYESYLKNK